MKIRIAVIFGGESVEHEISIITAQQAIAAFDADKYEIIPVYISKQNNWYVGDILNDVKNFVDLDFVVKNATQVVSINQNNRYYLYQYPFKMFKTKPVKEFDLAFPIVHGTNVEDGILQGFLENQRIPYVGPSVSGAAVGQDKVLMKMIWQSAQLPVLPFVWFYSSQWQETKDTYVKTLVEQLGFPLIIKPASLGSSVGISIAKDEETLIAAIDEATQYDDKIIVEEALTDFTEINCSVLGNTAHTKASALEKVFTGEELLSYQEKYLGGAPSKNGVKNTPSKMTQAPVKGKLSPTGGMANTSRELPAQLDEKMTQTIQNLAQVSFQTLGMSGVSRIDFLIDNKTNKVYLNEINTIPGSLSFYLWEATGISFTALLEELVQIAITRFRDKEKRVFTYDTNVLASHTTNQAQGTKGGNIKNKV